MNVIVPFLALANGGRYEQDGMGGDNSPLFLKVSNEFTKKTYRIDTFACARRLTFRIEMMRKRWINTIDLEKLDKKNVSDSLCVATPRVHIPLLPVFCCSPGTPWLGVLRPESSYTIVLLS
ncbi:hypothetical protein QTG54_009660 [Skeletonema marinoi]|uniref:Uncharacterized protein n=1 Tax=Skeletonema marinoi TaxID=267567 RepID=A0AAD9DA73_9STRA|nr:hypothetical protein QTG54_009660 [Skeletonema marinoi]